ncbi:MAG: hypothetical protein EOM24_12440 [Chloroflexia bacterium]|nr:hypothetical protein [Chloroflexia bacterium]
MSSWSEAKPRRTGYPTDRHCSPMPLGRAGSVDVRRPGWPSPPPPDALVRALIAEVRIAEGSMRQPDDGPETRIYATTATRAQALRAQFCGQGLIYMRTTDAIARPTPPAHAGTPPR